MTAARRFRIVQEPDTARPWIVQYDDDRQPETWKDAARFIDRQRASNYLAETQARDDVILKGERKR